MFNMKELSVDKPFDQDHVNYLLHDIAIAYPKANNNGLTQNACGKGTPLDFLDSEIFVRQVNTAFHWIVNIALKHPVRKSVDTGKTRMNSYNLKHFMEKWGSHNELESYVPNMAAIIVMLKFIDIKMELIGGCPNPYTNISAKAFHDNIGYVGLKQLREMERIL